MTKYEENIINCYEERIDFLLKKTGKDYFDFGLYFDGDMNRYGCVFAEYDTLAPGDYIETSDGEVIEIIHTFSFCKCDEICECMLLMCCGPMVKFAQAKVEYKNYINWNEMQEVNK